MSPSDPSSRPARVSRGLGWLRRRGDGDSGRGDGDSGSGSADGGSGDGGRGEGGTPSEQTGRPGASTDGADAGRGAAYRIHLVTRPGCHLCDEVRPVVAAVAEETGTRWQEVSLLDDPALMERWRDDIPVVLVDGALVARWRCDAATLRAALGSSRA